tara:strand:+ start:1542 stop:1889 length:348 start_codon:yes stop_codon:yes gene_type:complete
MTAAELKKPEKKESIWSQKERDTSKEKYGCEILIESGSIQDVSTKQAPTDGYIVKYVYNDNIHYDLARGTKVNLFDMYWDKFKNGIKSIGYGNGTIKPNLWGYQSTTTKKKKRKS